MIAGFDEFSTAVEGSGYFDDEQMTPEEKQFYKVMMFCYDLLVKTDLAQSYVRPVTSEDREDFELDDETKVISKYANSPDSIIDFTFALVAKKGKVNLREVLRQMMGVNKKTQMQLTESADIRQATISDYLTGKSAMNTDNFEKLINTIIS
jgi:hypothetical protein